MATKDWKKVSERKDIIHYGKNYDKKSGDLTDSLFVAFQDYDAQAWGYKKPSVWTVELDTGNTFPKTLKKFKTKTEAIKYAKSYMRLH